MGPDVGSDCGRARHHVVGEGAEALHLHRHRVARFDGARTGGGAAEDDVAGKQGDRRGEIGDEVGHIPFHLGGAAVLADITVDQGPDALVGGIPVGDHAGPHRAQSVRPFDRHLLLDLSGPRRTAGQRRCRKRETENRVS